MPVGTCRIKIRSIAQINSGEKISETLKKKKIIPPSRKGCVPWNKGKKNVYKKSVLNNWSKKRMGKMCGENHPAWRGGITPENIKIRLSTKTKKWRIRVFKRDNYTCQKSGERGGKLVAHHIQNFHKFPKLRFNMNNGITLSEKSHKEFHKKYGTKNNTKEQILSYLSGVEI